MDIITSYNIGLLDVRYTDHSGLWMILMHCYA